MPAARSRALALDRLERWFQLEVARPHERRLAGRPRTAAVQQLLPSRSLSAEQRLAIYSGGYMQRLLECMQADFPALQRVAGEQRFAELVRAYLERHPSRHWSLQPLGHSFARFLGRYAGPLPRRALLRELAELEWCMQEVFEAPACAALSHAELAAVPVDGWSTRRLVPVDALRLLAFDYRCNAIASAVRRGAELPALGPKRTWVAVYRKEWVVWRMDLDQARHALLAALLRGRTLAQAVAAGARTYRGPQAGLAELVRSSFAEWTAEGFFRAVE